VQPMGAHVQHRAPEPPPRVLATTQVIPADGIISVCLIYVVPVDLNRGRRFGTISHPTSTIGATDKSIATGFGEWLLVRLGINDDARHWARGGPEMPPTR
jgi:hypothetical protein